MKGKLLALLVAAGLAVSSVAGAADTTTAPAQDQKSTTQSAAPADTAKDTSKTKAKSSKKHHKKRAKHAAAHKRGHHHRQA